MKQQFTDTDEQRNCARTCSRYYYNDKPCVDSKGVWNRLSDIPDGELLCIGYAWRGGKFKFE